jgi:hypothetical protein
MEVSMKVRRWLVASIPGIAVLTVSCADPTALPSVETVRAAAAAARHHVVGSGHVQSAAGFREFTFHALAHPNGTVLGSYKVVLANGLFFEADVTCLSVVGNTGWVGGAIRATNAAAVVVGSGSMFYAIDNGEGAGGTADVVSVAAFNAAAGADLAFCADQPLALGPLTVTDGNVQVR